MFISYRRDDSQYQADKLHAALQPYVADPAADLFIDVDSIPFGADFAQHIESKVQQCDVLLAVIGKSWLSATDPATGTRRLDSPDDFVRLEISVAMRRGIPVVPVLLDGVDVPAPEDLPEELKPLARRNGVLVQRLSFEADIARLMKGLGYADASGADQARPKRRGRLSGLISILALAGLAGLIWTTDPLGWRTAPTSAAPDTVEPGPTAASGVDPVARLQDAALIIICELPDDEMQQASGVIVSPAGHILTAGNIGLGDGRCVAAFAGEGPAAARPITRLQRSRAYDAQLFRFADPERAVPAFLPPDKRVQPRAGDAIAAAGYPSKVGLELTTVFGRLTTDTPNERGVISTDAIFAGGTYGGPVILEETGELIGIIAGVQLDRVTGTVTQSYILSMRALEGDLLVGLE